VLFSCVIGLLIGAFAGGLLASDHVDLKSEEREREREGDIKEESR
jgi:hypothetical protein